MKKQLAFALACILTASSPAWGSEQVLTGEAPGKNGPVSVEVTVDNGTITGVTVTNQTETPGVADAALEQIPAAIAAHNSLAVDMIAGATVTSEAIVAAVSAALEGAGLSASAYQEPVQEGEELPAEESADVIVVGAGGAGLAAAAGAGEQGASVIVLEAAGLVGGSTIRSGGHMLLFDEQINAQMEPNGEALAPYLDYDPADFGEWGEALTAAQEQIRSYLDGEQAGRFDSPELALVDHYLKGSGEDRHGNAVTLDYALNKEVFDHAMELNAWLTEGGMQIQDKMYNAHGGTPVGGAAAMVEALKSMAENAGAKIILNMRAEKLLLEDGKVTGVTACDAQGNTHTYHAAKGVILATGSFSSNGEMAAKYQDIGDGLTSENGSTNPKTNVGDGLVMAEEAGAALRDLQFLTTVMEGYHEGSSLGEFGKMNGKQQLTVNAEGLRYMNETAGQSLGALTNDQPKGLAYFIGDKKMLDALEEAQEGFAEEMAGRGDWFVISDTLEEAVTKAGLADTPVLDTVEAFNVFVQNGEDPDFGRTEFNGTVEEPPFAVIKMEMHYHLTFGGLVIDTRAQVLTEEGEPIPGLYAAGDVISGFEGDVHQSGDCLSTVLYYGKVAGKNAAAQE